jgi:hypothetical protein
MGPIGAAADCLPLTAYRLPLTAYFPSPACPGINRTFSFERTNGVETGGIGD